MRKISTANTLVATESQAKGRKKKDAENSEATREEKLSFC